MEVIVFGDYYAEELTCEANAREIMKKTYELCGIGLQYATVSIDPAANAKTGIGPTMRGEYERMGVKGRDGKLRSWPSGPAHPKQDALAMIEALLLTGDGKTHIKIHPRCGHLIDAFKGYIRAQSDGQWLDKPKDPNHPYEDLIDPLCGGLKLEFPKGRSERPAFQEGVHASQIR